MVVVVVVVVVVVAVVVLVAVVVVVFLKNEHDWSKQTCVRAQPVPMVARFGECMPMANCFGE